MLVWNRLHGMGRPWEGLDFLGSRNFLHSSNHRGWGVKHSARNRMLANFGGELGDAPAKQVLSTTVLGNRRL